MNHTTKFLLSESIRGCEFYSNNPLFDYNFLLRTGSSQYGFTHLAGTAGLTTHIGEGSAYLGTTTNSPLGFYTNNSASRMTLFLGGNVSVWYGLIGVSYRLAVNGQVYAAVGFVNGSDARWKQNVATYNNALDKILNLRGITFEWKPMTGLNLPESKQIGFIA
jgi:hypothetical protein